MEILNNLIVSFNDFLLGLHINYFINMCRPSIFFLKLNLFNLDIQKKCSVY